MTRTTSLLSLVAVLGGAAALISSTAQSQVGPPKSTVTLQTTTPGSSQSGHSNISGTSRAGQFVGGGAGLVNVNADLLDGINSTAFLQGVPNPLVLSGTNSNAIIHATNNSGSALSAAIRGTALNMVVESYGGFFESNTVGVRAVGTNTGIVGISSGGFGVSGVGPFRGGTFHAGDVNGYGVYATATNTAIYANGLSGNGIDATGTTYGGKFTSLAFAGSGVFGQSASDQGIGVSGTATGIGGVTYGGKFQATNSSGIGVLGAGPFYGGQFTSDNVGAYGSGAFNGLIGSSPSGIGVAGSSNSGTGVAATSTSGIGVTGDGGSRGGQFNATAINGYGVKGVAAAGGGASMGVFGETNSPDGRGVFGITTANGLGSGGLFVTSSSIGGSAVEGRALAGTGPSVAVFGNNASSTGHGVRGIAAAGGVNYGVSGQSLSEQGYGGYFTGVGPDALYVQNTGFGRGILVNTNSDTAVWANATNAFAAVDGRNGNTTGIGLFGFTTAISGINYGVVGQTSSPSGYGVFAFGNSGATGTKSFRIDHPLDPENKYLLHYSTESPTPQNFYSGNAVTDDKGKAWVELPNYFSAINANFKYQLTVVDDSESESFVQAKIGREVQGNRFLVMTSAPNVKVSWRIEADRNDAWMQKYGAPTETQKSESARGKYQHPELFDQPKERAENFKFISRTPAK